MPPGTDDTDLDDEAPPAPPAAPASTIVQSVLDSPEYKELQKQNRKLARDNGTLKATEESARALAEQSRQAAEAQQQAALEQQIADILGEDGVQEWNVISELAGTNQVEAARRLKALMTRSADAQSAAVPIVAPVVPGSPAAGGNVDPRTQAPFRGVEADAPLSAPVDEVNQLIGTLETNFNDTVKRNLDPVSRNRMTMKERAAAAIDYLAASYLKSGARPRR